MQARRLLPGRVADDSAPWESCGQAPNPGTGRFMGASPDSIGVTMADDSLGIRAERPAATAEEGDYLRLEPVRTFGGTISCRRRLRLTVGPVRRGHARRPGAARGAMSVQVLSFYIRHD